MPWNITGISGLDAAIYVIAGIAVVIAGLLGWQFDWYRRLGRMLRLPRLPSWLSWASVFVALVCAGVLTDVFYFGLLNLWLWAIVLAVACAFPAANLWQRDEAPVPGTDPVAAGGADPEEPEETKWDTELLRRRVQILRAEVEEAYRKAEEDPYGIFVKPKTHWYYFIVGLYLTGLGASLYGAVMLGSVAATIIAFALIGWGIYSFIGIPLEVISAFSFAGLPIKTAGAGWQFLPRGVVDEERHKRNILQVEFPGDKDIIFWGDEDEELPEGLVRPIYITTGGESGKPTATQNPLDRQMTVGVSVAARMVVLEDGLVSFLQNIRPMNEEERLRMQRFAKTPISHREAEVIRQLHDTGTRKLREVFGKMSPALIIANWSLVSDYLRFSLQIPLIKWGVWLQEVSITNQNLSHKTNRFLAEVVRSGHRRQAALNDAAAERIHITERGAGEAAAARMMERELGEGLAIQARELGVDGEDVLSARVAGKLADSADTFVAGDAGMSGLAGVIKTVRDALTGRSDSA